MGAIVQDVRLDADNLNLPLYKGETVRQGQQKKSKNNTTAGYLNVYINC